MSNLTLENVTDYASAKAFIGNRDRAKLGHNTYLYRDWIDNSFYVEYHDNMIVEYRVDSTYVSNCGWHTPTTTNRLNKLTEMSFRIRQGAHQYLTEVGVWVYLNRLGLTQKFDGLDNNGKVISRMFEGVA
jgi:hypothetical protein